MAIELNFSMHCTVDIGNSFTKLYFFENNAIQKKFRFTNSEQKAVEDCLNNNLPEKTIISSVVALPEFYQKILVSPLVLNHQTPLPFKVDYADRKTLGADRVALAAAANFLFPHKNVLAIDAGTCITYDFIEKNNTYCGGSISPSLQMRLKSLNTFTDKLPLVEIDHPTNIELTGKTTKQSIQSGVFYGMLAEIEGIIEQYRSIYEDLTVMMTGGDADFFVLHLKNEIFADSNLQAIGLNHILNYNNNASKK
jgi:type III pantothenate kinase